MGKRLLLIAILVAIVSILYYFFYCMHYNHRYQRPAVEITYMLLDYIESNNGHFPTNEEDLVAQGYLRKNIQNQEVIYETRYGNSNSDPWGICPNFEKFDILYGIDVNDLNLINGKLYYKKDDIQVFLIKGPFRGSLKLYYEEMSRKLFLQAQKLKSGEEKVELKERN